MVVRKTCQGCGQGFDVSDSDARRGRGKFCSPACYRVAAPGRPHPGKRRRLLKACVVCGTEFETGGRAGKADKAFCSRDCRHRGRYRRGRVCAGLSPMDAAYLAGFWDGEGCFMLHGRADHGSIAFRVAAVGTKETVIRWIREVTGVGTVVCHRPTNPKWATRWTWWANGDAAESFTRQILPYLKLKPEQARMGVDFQERIRNPSFKADRSWQEDWRLRMRELNRRGPAVHTTTFNAEA